MDMEGAAGNKRSRDGSGRPDDDGAAAAANDDCKPAALTTKNEDEKPSADGATDTEADPDGAKFNEEEFIDKDFDLDEKAEADTGTGS